MGWGYMLLTVVHQNRSLTLRGGSTTVPIEQSVPSSKLYVYVYTKVVYHECCGVV